jgi:AraC-like DNA-binding protein
MDLKWLNWNSLIAVIAIIQLLIFIIFLFLKKKKRISNLILGAFLICQIFLLLRIILEEFYSLAYPYYVFIVFLSWIVAPLLNFYVKSITIAEFKLKTSDLIHLIPALVVTISYTLGITLHSSLIQSLNIFTLLIFPMITYSQFSFYSILSLKSVNSYKKTAMNLSSSYFDVNLNWLNIVIWGFLFSWLANAVVVFILGMQFVPYSNHYFLIPCIFFILFFNVLFFKGWESPQLFSEIEENIRYQTSKLTPEKRINYLVSLKKCMNEQKPFLNPDLKLKDLAEELDIPQRFLSQVINENYNQNFFDYINYHRIEEAKIIIESVSSKRNVLQLLYEAGFNSKSSFNTAFKKFTGMTPTEYKNSIRR